MQAEAVLRGYEVRWLIIGDASIELLNSDEHSCTNVTDAIAYKPDAVFAPGDRAPSFIPGIKVQVFHGLNEDKRGESYPERGLFDLYCTEGPARTAMLAPLAEKHGYFRVCETGWLKLDAILGKDKSSNNYDRPQVLYASTFTPRLSGAEALLDTIQQLSQQPQWQWLITLHPKTNSQTVAKYQALQNDNLSFHSTAEVIKLLQRADIMVSDNSSILQEFLLLNKPVVTYRNREPQPCMINIQNAGELENAILAGLSPESDLSEKIKSYGASITPFLDGKSANRILNATEAMLEEGWSDKKPANMLRNWKMRRQLNYFKL